MDLSVYRQELWNLTNDLESLLDSDYRIVDKELPPAQVRKAEAPAVPKERIAPTFEAPHRPESGRQLDRAAASPNGQNQKSTRIPHTAGSSDPIQGSGHNDLHALASAVSICKNCDLHTRRKQAVVGSGSEQPVLLVIGDAPEMEDENTGIPFSAAHDVFLDKWLKALNLYRDENVYLTQLTKCRAPGGRDPYPEECAECLPYLKQQVQLLQPKAILIVGPIAAQTLLRTPRGIDYMRGRIHKLGGIPAVVTYSPRDYSKSQAQLRRPVWEDLQLLKLSIT